ncbi:hypothetical protein [Hymenobacter radiodurans]|uniref:hypothetical protein n=1 Tax=Hymenobacter radiodurans TaxID=2496028 RepID=UPI001058B765|nr:hypothetical protein [Hymenobacter radiodurans]
MWNLLKGLVGLAASCLATVSVGLAQPTGHKLPTAAELKKNLALVEAGTEGESEAWDRLVEQTARQLVAYLRTHEVSAAAAENLGLDLSVDSRDATQLRVFTYSYSSGARAARLTAPCFSGKTRRGSSSPTMPTWSAGTAKFIGSLLRAVNATCCLAMKKGTADAS